MPHQSLNGLRTDLYLAIRGAGEAGCVLGSQTVILLKQSCQSTMGVASSSESCCHNKSIDRWYVECSPIEPPVFGHGRFVHSCKIK